jgi:hypothetical protein
VRGTATPLFEFFAEALERVKSADRFSDSAQNVPNIAHFPQKSMI